MSKLRVDRMWGNFIGSTIALVLIFFVLPPFLMWKGMNLPTSKPHNYEEELLHAILFIVAVTGAGLLVVWEGVKVNFLTEFTEQGMRQRQLFGWRFIAWDQVKSIVRIGYGINVVSEQQTIVFNPITFRNWIEVRNFIKTRVPEGAFRLDERSRRF